MSTNTTNLDLLKMDPAVDGNSTFNIETMLNENWDKVDAAVGERETLLKQNPTKTTPVDADSAVFVQGSDQKTKRVTWAQIKTTLKAFFDTVYSAAAHSHAWAAITSKPLSFPPDWHSHSWDSVTTKPTSFPPSAHNQNWSTIDGKPSSFAPSAHKVSHATGGADELTPADIGAAKKYTGSGTLTVAGWTGAAAPFTQTLTAAGITAADTPLVDYLGGTDAAAKKLFAEAFALVVAPGVVKPQTVAGAIKFYCDEKPTVNIPIRWEGTR